MNIVTLFLTRWFPLIVAFAADPPAGATSTVTVQNVSFIDKAVGWAAGLGGGIIAIFIIVSLVKDGIEFSKGQGSASIWKIIGKVLFLLIVLGLIFLAVNYKSLGNTAKNLGDKGINIINNEATNLINP